MTRVQQRWRPGPEAAPHGIVDRSWPDNGGMLTAGTCLDKYEIIAPLAVGGMGAVYRARDPELGRDVAIKILPMAGTARPEAVVRFRRETKVVASLAHPNIVRIYDAGVYLGRCFAVMELLDGETLRKRLSRSVLKWRRAAATGAAVADGLSAAHAKGIIHLDLKPENIFLTADGWVKILDFGIAQSPLHALAEPIDAAARTDGSGETSGVEVDSQDVDESGGMYDTAPAGGQRDTVLGTPPYMSPEQVRGEAASPASDVFSLGCVLYEMVTGRRPFARHTDDDIKDAILNEDPPDIADWGTVVPSSFERVIVRCLEKRRSERFQSASDLAFTLRSLSTAWVFGLPFRFRLRAGRFRSTG